MLLGFKGLRLLYVIEISIKNVYLGIPTAASTTASVRWLVPVCRRPEICCGADDVNAGRLAGMVQHLLVPEPGVPHSLKADLHLY